MPVDPLLLPLLDVTSSMGTAPPVSITDSRAAVNARSAILIATHYATPPEPAAVTEQTIPVDDGEISVRIYRPDRASPHHPWWRVLARQSGLVRRSMPRDLRRCGRCRRLGRIPPRTSTHSRLHRRTATPHSAGSSTTLTAACIDPAAISVGGESAGGNLAAVVALMARDRQGPGLVLQVPGNPGNRSDNEPTVDQKPGHGLPAHGGRHGAVPRPLPRPRRRHTQPVRVPDPRGRPRLASARTRHDDGIRPPSRRG